MFAISQSSQSKPPIPNDKLPLRFKRGKYVLLGIDQLCSSIFTKDSNKRCLDAAKPLIELACKRSKEFNSLCKDFVQSSATLRLLPSTGYKGYGKTTMVSPEAEKEREIKFPFEAYGIAKGLTVNTVQHVMHQLVLEMAGPDNNDSIAGIILSEMGIPARNAAPTIDLVVDSPPEACNAKDSEPDTHASKRIEPSASGRQSSSEVACVFSRRSQPLPLLARHEERPVAVKRKGDVSTTAISAPKIGRWNLPPQPPMQMRNECADYLQEHAEEYAPFLLAEEPLPQASPPKTSCAKSNNSISDIADGRELGRSGDTDIIGAPKKPMTAGAQRTLKLKRHLRIWKSMPPEERKKWRIKKYAVHHGLKYRSFRVYANKAGLTKRGVYFLERGAKDTMKEHVRAWVDRPEDQRKEQGSIADYAGKHGLDLDCFEFYVDASGLTKSGEKFLEKPDENDYTKMTAQHLLECVDLLESAEEKSEVISDYASEQCLYTHSFRHYVNIKGLTKYGKTFLEAQKKKVLRKDMAEHLEILRDMPEDQREEQGGIEGYAEKNGLKRDIFELYADAFGLTKAGEKFIDKYNKKVRMTVAHLERWRDMSEDERTEQGGVVGYAKKHRLRYTTFEHYVCATGLGLREPGVKFLEREKGVYNPKTAETSITPELNDPVVESNEHTYDNTQPYVRDAQGHALSLVLKKGRRPTLGLPPELQKLLDEMPSEKAKVKRRIRVQVNQWLKDEGPVAGKKLDDLLEVRRPSEGPSRGNSVFAKELIEKFDVIGFYAGELLSIKKGEYAKKCEKHGENYVDSYAYDVEDEDAVLSGLNAGNVLSIINSIQPDPKVLTHPAFKGMRNNLQACTLGRHGIFLIAMEDIKPREELFLDYGPKYKMYVH
ncbi:MAG: hypothetical protein JWQ10_3959 [Herbaspirillum sp.]|nr:hypothetical protein [Herbaspirillum sp.]